MIQLEGECGLKLMLRVRSGLGPAAGVTSRHPAAARPAQNGGAAARLMVLSESASSKLGPQAMPQFKSHFTASGI